MLREIRPALVTLALLSAITGLAYPLLMTGIGQALFPSRASGSLVVRDGKVVGSALIGQDFSAPGYFHSRPSATTAPDPRDATRTVPAPYNASNSAGSNLGPTAKALVDRVQADVEKLKADNPDAVRQGLRIPMDLVTASGSGLDPDITPAAALFQAPRVARARDLPEERVRALIATETSAPLLGILGERRVNVLALNLALDRIK
jgi:K+-transporting ATPase ATPase C chain